MYHFAFGLTKKNVRWSKSSNSADSCNTYCSMPGFMQQLSVGGMTRHKDRQQLCYDFLLCHVPVTLCVSERHEQISSKRKEGGTTSFHLLSYFDVVNGVYRML